MSVAQKIPGTVEWLLARVDVRVEMRLRKELRQLQRDLDATFTGLWVAAAREDILIEFAGECAIAPERYPYLTTTVPTFETVTGADGEKHDAAVHRPRIGRGMPRIGLIAIDPPEMNSSDLLAAMEASGERVEEIIVRVL